MRIFTGILILLTIAIALVACGGGPSEPATAAPEAASPAEAPVVEEPTEGALAEEPTVPTEAVEPEERPVVQPPSMDDPGVLNVELFEMDADGLPVEGWGKTLAAGARMDLNVPPGNNGFPPFVFVDFSSPGDAAFPDPTAIFGMDLNSVTQEEIDAAEADLTGYLAGVTQKMADVADSDYAPDLSALKAAIT